MQQMQRRSALLGLVALGLLPGCGRTRFYAPQAEFDDHIQIRVRNAYVRGDRFWVKTYVVNGGSNPIQVNRDAWTLRLPDGRAFPRRKSMGQAVYLIPPGQGRNVDLDFEASDETWEGLSGAALVIAGVSVGDDPVARAIGEIPLSRSPAQMMGPPAPPPPGPSPSASAAAPLPPEPAPPPSSAAPPPSGSAPPAPPPTVPSVVP